MSISHSIAPQIAIARLDLVPVHSARMKILINCSFPFALAHGGQQIQIERTKAILEFIGIEVEPVRWWDDTQSGDIIHYFGRIPSVHIEFAHQKGIKVVMGELLTSQGSRTGMHLWTQRMLNRALARFGPKQMMTNFNWASYRISDAIIAMTPWEAHLMSYLYGAPPEKIHIVPNGVEDAFFDAAPSERGKWLVCTATITQRKRVLELAEAAVRAQTPLWIVGKAYAEADPYAQKFSQLAKQHPNWIRLGGPPLKDREGLARIYREARGFVLLSAMETRSLAAEEAAACECRLLLSDLPWARSVFGDRASYCPIASSARTAHCMRRFYHLAPTLPPPPKPLREEEMAQKLKAVYEKALSAA
jgi:glycosyltransferase involved in cell wall biosynthesis